MKYLICLCFTLLLIATSACSEQTDSYTYEQNQDDMNSGGHEMTSNPDRYATPRQQTSGNNQVVMHRIMDTKRNMVMSEIPLPANWQLHKPTTMEDPAISGPGGVKVYYRMGGQYTYSQDPYTQQIYQQSGQPMRAPISAEQIVVHELIPQLQNNGMQFVKQYPLQQVAQRNQAYSSKLFKSMPSQDSFDSVGSEWTDKNGTPVLVIVDLRVNSGQGTTFWSYNLTALEASRNHFEAARNALIYGIVNTRDNPQQIQAYNASEQQKTNQSWAQHNSRIQQNQRNFDRQQQIHRSTTDAINNSIMSTYNNSNAASDRMQQRTINSINEEETVTNPYDGQQYRVGAGANQYWMNNNGEHIESNDAFYNPNRDQNLNNQDWQEVVPE